MLAGGGCFTKVAQLARAGHLPVARSRLVPVAPTRVSGGSHSAQGERYTGPGHHIGSSNAPPAMKSGSTSATNGSGSTPSSGRAMESIER